MTHVRDQVFSSMRSSTRINCSLFTEYKLVQENILLQNERITQLYVIQSEQNPYLWFGVLFVDSGIYRGAVIRFNMYIDDSYPQCPCPKIVFDPIPYHPLVNPMTGELDTKNAFPDWDSNSRKLFELLLFVKRVIRHADEYIIQVKELILKSSVKNKEDELAPRPTINQAINKTNSTENAPSDYLTNNDNDTLRSQQENVIDNTPSCSGTSDGLAVEQDGMNQDECRLDQNLNKSFTWLHHTMAFIETYENDKAEFDRRIQEFKEKCYEQLLDRPALCGDDRNALVFTPWDMEVHEPIRTCILTGRFTQSSLFAAYHKETDSVSFIPGHSNNY